ncbi:MAG TPA: SGNH/GDSL hydrolase family protein [Acidobacteriaceae bacterium]|nr:SGNH/GDSL hydrolase family protein [Acidobacteriaceae bacterium]
MDFIPIVLHFQGRDRSVLRRRVAVASVLAFATMLWTIPAGYAANAAPRSPWVATWGAGMMATAPGSAHDITGQTLREIVHTSVGGSQVRVWLSNRFGSEPLHIGAAHIAVSASESAGVNPDGSADDSGIAAGTDRALTFNQSDSVVIPAGAEVVSDPVALVVPALSNLAVSMYFPDRTMATTEHSSAQQISYAATGNQLDAANLAGKDWPDKSWYVLSGVDVEAPGDSAVVAFGDSITDGAHATVNENHRWPDYLASRLAADANTKKAGVLGVVNVGIGGNRVLLDGAGPNAVSRINWDVLARSGARYVIVLESINDIGRFATDHQPYGDLAQRLEAGIAQIAAQAHQHGIQIIGATITPYQGAGYYSEGGEAVREAVNQWIRTSPTFDGFADFDKAVRDPQNPLHFAAEYDSGDHLHPADAGYKAMADSIDLSLFTKKK